VDLAVGVVVGTAFGAVVTSFVKNLLTPLIAAIVRQPDFSALSVTINSSMFQYSEFINSLLSFVLISAAVYFFVVLPINALIARAKKSSVPADPRHTQMLGMSERDSYRRQKVRILHFNPGFDCEPSRFTWLARSADLAPIKQRARQRFTPTLKASESDRGRRRAVPKDPSILTSASSEPS
jgi:large conductance mechanosensitive channel protein